MRSMAAGLACLACMSVLAQCGGPRRHAQATPETLAAASLASSDDVLTIGDTLLDLTTLPLEKRVALHSAEIRAALALWNAGHANEAALHFDGALAKASPRLIAGFDALGYDADSLSALRDAAAAGDAADDHADAIAKEEAASIARIEAAGGEVADIISFLVTTCVVEYRASVTPSELLSEAGYARAWGRAQIAHDLIAARVDGPDHPSADALLQAQLLVRLWPREGPVLGSVPAPLSLVDSQAARVNLEAASLSN
jgi:hypothetical protein